MMYQRAAFAVTDAPLVQAFLQQHPLGLLLCVDPASGEICHSALPLSYQFDSAQSLTGAVTGHLARANPQLALLQAIAAKGQELLILVQGPDAFVPGHCYAKQPQVSTWNYLLVELRGRLTIMDGADTLQQVRAQEAQHGGVAPAQADSEALALFQQKLLSGIVGFRLQLSSVRAKMKLSQNRAEADQTAVLSYLQQHENAKLLWPWQQRLVTQLQCESSTEENA